MTTVTPSSPVQVSREILNKLLRYDSNTFDPLANPHLMKDATDILGRYVLEVIAGVYRQQFPPLWTANNAIIPTTYDLNLIAIGTDTMLAFQNSIRGKFGKTVAGYVDATDIPTIKAQRAQEKFSALMAASSITWDMMQTIRENALIQVGMLEQTSVQLEIEGARLLAEQDQHYTALFGLAPDGHETFKGLLNLNGATETELAIDIYDLETTGDQIYDTFANALVEFKIRTRLDIHQCILILPTRAMVPFNRETSTQPVTPTVYQKLTDSNYPIRVKEIYFQDELESPILEENNVSPDGTDKDKGVLYLPDARQLKRKIYPLTYLNDFTKEDMKFSKICYYGQTELVVPEPYHFEYFNFPTHPRNVA